MSVAMVALLSSGYAAPVSAQSAGRATAPAMQSLSTSTCSTAQLSDVMAVYLATPAPRATPIPIPAPANTYLGHILRSRLATCVRQLGWTSPAPPPPSRRGAACVPAPSARNDSRMLWAQLKFCEALSGDPPAAAQSAAASSGAAPSVIPWRLPAAASSGNRQVIFVLALGGDIAMQSKLVSTLVGYLNAGKDETGYRFAGDAVLVPEPGWTPNDYAQQCENSPNVQGAIVMQITAAGSGASDEFIRRRNWSAIEATGLYARCGHASPSSRGAPAYVWISDIAKAQNQHYTLTPLMPLSLLLTLGGVYEEFAPARSTSISTTRVYPNPSPIPAGGRATQTVSTNSTSFNAGSLGALGNSFLGTSISYANSSAPLTQGPTVDQQTWNTLQSVVIALMTDMNCWQPSPEAIGPRTARDVVGPARRLPEYNPPAGLGTYSSGNASAPFCGAPASSESVNDILPSQRPR